MGKEKKEIKQWAIDMNVFMVGNTDKELVVTEEKFLEIVKDTKSFKMKYHSK